MLYCRIEKSKRTTTTYIVIREGLPAKAFSGIDYCCMNSSEREKKTVYRKIINEE